MLTKIFGDNVEVYVYENFLTPEELSLISSEISRANQNSLWESAVGVEDDSTWVNRNFYSKDYSDELLDLFKSILWRTIEAYSESVSSIMSSYLKFTGMGPINRTSEGQSLPVHDDLGPPELKAPVTHGVVIYFNDDFDGGELYYEGLGLEIKPKPGTLVIHPSTAEYRHGVRTVTRGTRYGTTMFVLQPPSLEGNQ